MLYSHYITNLLCRIVYKETKTPTAPSEGNMSPVMEHNSFQSNVVDEPGTREGRSASVSVSSDLNLTPDRSWQTSNITMTRGVRRPARNDDSEDESQETEVDYSHSDKSPPCP